MAANTKRTPFNPSGPFVAKKNFSIFETNITVGEKLAADVFFPRMHERRVEQLFDAKYIDMAIPDDKRAKHLADFPGADPLDRDGDGAKGGSLSDIEQAALSEAGLSLETWLALPEPERTNALADALSRAGRAEVSPPPGESGGAGGNSGGGDGATGGEQAAGGPETGAAGDAAANGDADANTPADLPKIAAYKHFGFGRWFAVDAEGGKIGDKLSKTEAEQQAALHNVPLQGLI